MPSEPLSLAELQQRVAHDSEGWFAILDNCDDAQVSLKLDQLKSLDQPVVCLYAGRSAIEYAAIAPYLVQLTPDLLQWVADDLVDHPWGFLLQAPLDMAELRRHLRRFLTVLDADGQTMLFRFYDPRVLPPFLASCSADQQHDFFGPIESIYIPMGSDFHRWTPDEIASRA